MTVESRTALRCDARTRWCLGTFEAVGGVNVTRSLAREQGWRFDRTNNADHCPGCEYAEQYG